MTTQEALSSRPESALTLLRDQCSHLLLVLSDAVEQQTPTFREWYVTTYRSAALDAIPALSARYYEQHEVDITRGRYAPLPYRYMAVYELSLDGAEQAEPIIERVAQFHAAEPSAREPATWLYYPASEKVGRSPSVSRSPITVAFANGVPGQETEFREWYATRHIRHALKIPALVSGQCFERTQFQRAGALEARFSTIAVYEQEGTPQDILNGFASLPDGALYFPMLDRSRFAEWVYKPV